MKQTYRYTLKPVALWVIYGIILYTAWLQILRHTGYAPTGTLRVVYQAICVLGLHWKIHLILSQIFLLEQCFAEMSGRKPRQFSIPFLNQWYSTSIVSGPWYRMVWELILYVIFAVVTTYPSMFYYI